MAYGKSVYQSGFLKSTYSIQDSIKTILLRSNATQLENLVRKNNQDNMEIITGNKIYAYFYFIQYHLET